MNVFGIQADFTQRFKDFLNSEKLPANDKNHTYDIPIKITIGLFAEQHIKSLRTCIEQGKPICSSGALDACVFPNHLYCPLMHVAKGSAIQITPAPLNDSEFEFVQDLYHFLQQGCNDSEL